MARIQIKRGTAASWSAANPILATGEWGVETDTGKIKLGDGFTAWASLTPLPGLDETGRIPASQVPAGLVVDEVTVVGDSFQFYSEGQAIGDPVSLLIARVDGGSPVSTSLGSIDGGTI